MAKELLAVSDGTFTLSETGIKNHFYFYRNDKEILGNISQEPLDLYTAYIFRKMMTGETIDIVIHNNISTKKSDDGKCILLIVSD